MKNKKLTIFIPCFNEEKNIDRLVSEWDLATENSENIFILFIDNGSNDNTLQKLRESIEITKNKRLNFFQISTNKGYGYGILKSINNDNSEILCWTHADLQFEAEEIITMATNYLIQNDSYKLLKGKRISRSIFDKLFTNLMSLVGFIFKFNYIYDINAQPKIFSRELYEKISNWPIDFSLDAHLLYESRKYGIKIESNPIEMKPRIYEAAKGGGTIKGKIRLSFNILKYFLGKYKKF